MNLQQHKKAWEDFKATTLVKYWEELANSPEYDLGAIFLKKPFVFQLGLLLEYLEEKDISYSFQNDESNVIDNNGEPYDGFWEQGHRKGAIEQAFKTINEQLIK